MSAARSSAADPFLEILHDQCIECAACVAVCEPESLTLSGLQLLFDAESCTACVECLRVCPAAALAPTSGSYYREIA